jgi:hypothetical protein
VNLLGASPIGAAAGSQLSKSLFSQPVQTPRLKVLLHLQIPFAGIKGFEPGPELRPLLRGQLLDGSFDGLHGGHSKRLERLTGKKFAPRSRGWQHRDGLPIACPPLDAHTRLKALEFGASPWLWWLFRLRKPDRPHQT